MSSTLRKTIAREWTTETSIELIEEYEKFPLLWDTKHPDHFSRYKKTEAWELIAAKLRIDVPQVIQKMNSLLGSFRREKKKGMRNFGIGHVRNEKYVSKWFGFDRMQFLLDRDERSNMDTEQGDYDEHEVDSDHTLSNLGHEHTLLDGEEQNLDQNETAVSGYRSFTTPVPPRARKRKISDKDETRLQEAFNTLREFVSKKEMPPDHCGIYVQYVANKLRSYNTRTRVQVENAINNILFEADMGRFDNAVPSSSSDYENDLADPQYPAVHFLDDGNTAPVSPAPSASPPPATSTSSVSNSPTPVPNHNPPNSSHDNVLQDSQRGPEKVAGPEIKIEIKNEVKNEVR